MKWLIRKFFEKYSRENELFEKIWYLERRIERDQNDWFAERAAKQQRIDELMAMNKALEDPLVQARMLQRMPQIILPISETENK